MANWNRGAGNAIAIGNNVIQIVINVPVEKEHVREWLNVIQAMVQAAGVEVYAEITAESQTGSPQTLKSLLEQLPPQHSQEGPYDLDIHGTVGPTP